jgi:hypothetical protein
MMDLLGGRVGQDMSYFYGSLIPGWALWVLGDALQGWQSLGSNATKDVDSEEATAVAAGIGANALKVGNGGSAVRTKGCEKVGSHFEAKEGWVSDGPAACGLKGGCVRQPDNDMADCLLDWFVVGVGGKPGEEAREGVCPDGTDGGFGLHGGWVPGDGAWVKHRQLRQGATRVGRLRWRWVRPREEKDQGQEGSSQQNGGVSGFHVCIVDTGDA